MEYFPLILKERIELFYKARSRGKEPQTFDDINEITEQVCIIHQGEQVYDPHLFCQGDFLDDDILYEYSLNPELRKLNGWVIRRIILQEVSWQTLQVRLNIAINVLARLKLKYCGRNLRICIQDNIVKNCWAIHRAKLAQELPFYQG